MLKKGCEMDSWIHCWAISYSEWRFFIRSVADE